MKTSSFSGSFRAWHSPGGGWGSVAVAIFAVLVIAPSRVEGATLPAGFAELTINDTWDEFAGVTFDEVGAVYAWDRKGRVWIIENDVKLPTPLIDISDEVGAWDD